MKKLNLVIAASLIFLAGCKINVTPSEKTSNSNKDPSISKTDFPEVIFPTTPEPIYTEYLYYEDFGAKGDGVTDDMQAIVKTHEEANKQNLPVKAKAGAKYYIVNSGNGTAKIKTDCDWTGAEFIIDDSNLTKPADRNFIFSIPPSTNEKCLVDETLANGGSYKGAYNQLKNVGIQKNATNLGIELPKKSVIWLENANVKRFKRNQSGSITAGTAQEDTIVVESDGTIDSETPLNWSYDYFSRAHYILIDEKTLYIKGGTFTTIVNRCTPILYVSGGIQITRSNVIVDGLSHNLENEGTPEDYSSPYYGIFYIKKCAYITLKNCKVSSHITYKNRCGTYDIYPYEVDHLRIINCEEITSINDSDRWGVIGSNFCKDIRIYDSKLSRFDAHQGVTNAYIKNSTIGWAGINLIGEGIFKIEDSTCYGANFIRLREDYGSSWRGDIQIKNCRWIPRNGTEQFSSSMACIIGGKHIYNFDFGYDCYMPQEIYIDGFEIDDSMQKPGYYGPYLLGEFIPPSENDAFEAVKEKYPFHITKDIYFRNFTSTSGTYQNYYGISANTKLFNDVIIHTEWK